MQLAIYEQEINAEVLGRAFDATCKKRSTENLRTDAPQIIAAVENDEQLHVLWKSYQNKYPYAATISYEDIMKGGTLSFEMGREPNKAFGADVADRPHSLEE